MKKLFIPLLATAMMACQVKPNRIPIKTGQEGKPIASINFLLPDSITRLNIKDIPGGKPVVLIFFSPFCPYCRAEISDIVKNINTLSGARIYMLTNFPLANLRSFDSLFHLSQHTEIVTGVDYTNSFTGLYRTPGIPLNAIFDHDKKLKEAFVGRMTAKQIAHAAGLD